MRIVAQELAILLEEGTLVTEPTSGGRELRLEMPDGRLARLDVLQMSELEQTVRRSIRWAIFYTVPGWLRRRICRTAWSHPWLLPNEKWPGWLIGWLAWSLSVDLIRVEGDDFDSLVASYYAPDYLPHKPLIPIQNIVYVRKKGRSEGWRLIFFSPCDILDVIVKAASRLSVVETGVAASIPGSDEDRQIMLERSRYAAG